MSPTTATLHGSAPDQHDVAVLLIDVINPFDFPEAEQLLAHAVPMAARIASLKRRAKAARVPVIYANDNFGRWRSDLSAVVERCQDGSCLGRPVIRQLLPEADDYFVLKPKHSAFFSTVLDTLLKYLGTRTLIVTGVAGNICVLFTANDAYMRDYRVVVPPDCVASNTADANQLALNQMRAVLKCELTPSEQIDFAITGEKDR